MRISSEWLHEFVDVPAAGELYHIFQMAGLGVEERHDDGDSTVWTLEVTSNRGDWLSSMGLAREIAAMTDKRFHFPTHPVQEKGAPLANRVEVEIEDAADCPRYAARLIENIQIGPSPEWMQKRLTECGMRPLNNVVDITNYVMLETGQPLHAFDADKVLGADGVHRIRVRRARDGERMTTLDDVERELTSEVLLITDGETPLAIAGVMGGHDSEVGDGTTKVLLESAHFAPSRVRRGKRVAGLSSEASRRFERWVDPNTALCALDRAAQLLAEHASGEVAQGIVDRYEQPILDARVTLRPARCNAVLGLRLTSEQMIQKLERLQLKIGARSEELIEVLVPTFRRDIEREIDLIEEVARVHGYEHIPSTLPREANTTAGRALSQRLEERARGALLRCGLSEVVTYSLENAAGVARAGLEAVPAVRLRNPLSDDYSQLRTSMLPSMLEVLGKNPRQPVRIFELGRVYLPLKAAQPEAAQPEECPFLGMALLAAPPAPHWQKTAMPVDFFALKGIIERLLDAMGAPAAQFVPVKKAPFHPGRCASISLDGQELGVIGELHPEVAARYELPHRAYLAEIQWNALVRHVRIAPQYRAVPKFPPIERDLAFVLKNSVPAAQVERTLRAANESILEDVRVFDVYTGPPVPEGWKSLAIALRFRASDRTLRDEEVEEILICMRARVESELGAQLRS
ncbi:MAG: phenylalanyl-tRNA synthetase beta chain [Abditibacteriota bacterium]|nr:phenylalanyl-tRNA synthetase beta chain [Abditibacteriota bacterium]